MPKYKLVLAYDGTAYSGWQIQPNALSIQELVEKAIELIIRNPVRVIASGRTDAGVHARGQVAHFTSPEEIDLRRFFVSMNGLLPRDIRIKEISPVPDHFHAQYSVLKKTYHYHLCLDRFQNPFKRLYSLHVRESLDLIKMEQAAKLFVGTHDYTSFANENHCGRPKSNVRTIHRLDLIPEEGGIRLEFEGNGFLYKMVRNISGTLIEAARGKKDLEDILALFAAKDRKKTGKAAAAHALFLDHVVFPNEFGISSNDL